MIVWKQYGGTSLPGLVFQLLYGRSSYCMAVWVQIIFYWRVTFALELLPFPTEGRANGFILYAT